MLCRPGETPATAFWVWMGTQGPWQPLPGVGAGGWGILLAVPPDSPSFCAGGVCNKPREEVGWHNGIGLALRSLCPTLGLHGGGGGSRVAVSLSVCSEKQLRHDHYLVPNALVEQALLWAAQGRGAEAVSLLRRAKCVPSMPGWHCCHGNPWGGHCILPTYIPTAPWFLLRGGGGVGAGSSSSPHHWLLLLGVHISHKLQGRAGGSPWARDGTGGKVWSLTLGLGVCWGQGWISSLSSSLISCSRGTGTATKTTPWSRELSSASMLP